MAVVDSPVELMTSAAVGFSPGLQCRAWFPFSGTASNLTRRVGCPNTTDTTIAPMSTSFLARWHGTRQGP